LVNGDNKNSFIKYIEIILLKYTHYPNLVKDCYSIILSILKRANEEHLGKFLTVIDLKIFQYSFEIYRFNLRGSLKDINLLFLKILYILVSYFQKKSVKEKLIDVENFEQLIELDKDRINNAFREKYYKILEILVEIFSSFFDTTNKRYINFVKKKFLDLKLQDLLLKIGSILFVYEINIEKILHSDFMNNLARYLLKFSFGKCQFMPKTDIDSLRSKDNKIYNFINFISEKKNKNLDTIKIFTSSIILSAFEIYKELLNHDNKYFAEVAVYVIKNLFLILNF